MSFAWQNPITQTGSPSNQAAPTPISFGTRPGQGALDYRSNQPNEPSLSAINDLLAELTGRQAGFGISLQPRREQSILDFLNVMNPANQTAQARSQFGALLGAGQEAGRMHSQGLARAGYGQSVQQGAQLGARNQAARQGQQNLLALTSPQAKAQNLAQMMQVLNQSSNPSSLGGFLNAYQAEMGKNQYEDSRSGGGLLGSILGIGSQLSGLGVFGGMGGGSQSSGSGGGFIPQVF
jgi:hypothetical protein